MNRAFVAPQGPRAANGSQLMPERLPEQQRQGGPPHHRRAGDFPKSVRQPRPFAKAILAEARQACETAGVLFHISATTERTSARPCRPSPMP